MALGKDTTYNFKSVTVKKTDYRDNVFTGLVDKDYY